MKIFFDKFYQISALIIIILPIIILAWLIKKDLVLDGRLVWQSDFSRLEPALTVLFPESRTSDIFRNNEGDFYWQEITSEPVYFEARLPQNFETARVELEFQDQGRSLIQLGLRVQGESDWNYYFKPLSQPELNDLNWFRLDYEGGSLWQKEKRYLAINQFFDDWLKVKDQIAYSLTEARANPGKNFLLVDYFVPTVINNQVNLRPWLKGNAVFDLTKADIQNRKLRFALSIPELNNGNKSLPVRNIKIFLTKEPLSFGEIISKFASYVRNRF